jgi:putative membrane protein
VIFKNNFPTGATTWLVAGLAVFMAATIQLYARKRRLDREKEALDSSPEPQALQNS